MCKFGSRIKDDSEKLARSFLLDYNFPRLPIFLSTSESKVVPRPGKTIICLSSAQENAMSLRCVGHIVLPLLAVTLSVAWFPAEAIGVNLRVLGLEQAWTAQSQASLDGRGVVSARLWLNSSQKRSYAVAELSERTVHVAADQLGPDLQPLGMEAAKAAVRAQAARILGQTDGFEVVERSIGQLRLVITNGNGLIQCFDAESGRLIWATPCGDEAMPTIPAALSDAGVLVVRGDWMYLLDWGSGKQLQIKRLPSGTCNSVTAIDVKVTDPGDEQAEEKEMNSLVLATDRTGLVSGYSLSQQIPPWSFRIVGRSVGTPVRLPNKTYTAIATNIGWLYVFSGTRSPSVQFRFEAGSQFTGSLAAGDNAFYVGDVSGKVSKISTLDLGNLEWSYRLSQSISSVPLVDFARGLVFVSSEAGELTAINDSTGLPAWDQTVLGSARIKAPMSLCNGSVICRTFSQTLVAYDALSGQLLGQTPTVLMDGMTVVNSLTDRLYLLGRNGELSCYRPIGKTLPKISAVYGGETRTPSESQQPDSRSTTSPAPGSSENLSFQDSDPFGEPTSGDTSAESQTNQADPFGEDSDPFAEETP